jgi:hypothetical protein
MQSCKINNNCVYIDMLAFICSIRENYEWPVDYWLVEGKIEVAENDAHNDGCVLICNEIARK